MAELAVKLAIDESSGDTHSVFPTSLALRATAGPVPSDPTPFDSP
jgi:hypothetical protein